MGESILATAAAVTVVVILKQNCTQYEQISNVNDTETKAQTFRYRSLLSERKRNILIWSAYYRNESKTF